MPVFARISSGLIYDVQFNSDDAEWSRNFKRSVLNLISLSEQQATIYESVLMNEKMIEGECEVLYTVNQESNETVINKSVNSKKCETQPIVIYGNHSPDDINIRTDYTYILQGELLKRVEVKSIYTQSAKVVTYARLVHIKTEMIKTRIREVDGDPEDLIYSTKNEKLMEDFFKNGDDAKENPFKNDSIDEKIHSVDVLLKKLDENEQTQPFQLVRFVRLLRFCTFEQLDEIFIFVREKKSEKLNDIIEHALSLAGTKNTIEYVTYLIHKGTISPKKGTLLLKSIQSTLYPSCRIADTLIELAASKVSKSSKALRQAALLASGVVVHGIITQTTHLIDENTSEMRKKYLEVFNNHYRCSDSDYEKIIVLKALGNAGIKESIDAVERIINDDLLSIIVRETAIDSLRLLGNIVPHKIRKILLKVFRNYHNVPQLRMTALSQIMKTRPPQSIISRIESLMKNELNQRVKKYTNHHLSRFGKNNTICSDCQYSIFDSIIQSFAPNLFYEHFPNVHSFIPKKSLISWDDFQIGIIQHNLDKYLEHIIDMYQKRILPNDARQRLELVKKLIKILNHGSSMYDETHGIAYLRVRDMDLFIFQIDEQLVSELFGEYINTGEISFLYQHIESHIVSYFRETEFVIPTTSGFPIFISTKSPTLLSIKACRNILDLNVIGSQFNEMSMRTPLFKQGVNSIQSITLSLPMNLGLSMKKIFGIEVYGKIFVPSKYRANFKWSSCSKIFVETDDRFILIPQNVPDVVVSKSNYRIFGLEVRTAKTFETLEIIIENPNKRYEIDSSLSFTRRPFNIAEFMKTVCYRSTKSVFGLRSSDVKTFVYENYATFNISSSLGHKMYWKMINYRDSLDKFSLWDSDFLQTYSKLGYDYTVRNMKGSMLLSRNKLSTHLEWENTPQCLSNFLSLSGVLEQSDYLNHTQNYFNQLRIMVDYEFDKSTREKLQSYIQDYTDIYWDSSLNDKNRMYINLTVNPNTRREANITFQTCLQPTPFVWTVETPEIQLPTSIDFHPVVCEYSTREVSTFDEHIYRSPQTTCNTLITGIDGKFKVLVSRKWKHSKRITITVVAENGEITLSKLQNYFSVRLGDEIISITDYGNYNISIDEQNMFFDLNYCLLEYNGETLRIQPKLYDRHKFVGMCGNVEENGRAAKHLPSNLDVFIEKSDDCEASVSFHDEDRDMNSDEPDYEEDFQEGLQQRTEIKEFAYKTCFSMEGVPTCSENYEELEVMKEDVKYTCFSRHDSITRHYIQKVLNGTVLRLDLFPISLVETVMIPIKCTHNN